VGSDNKNEAQIIRISRSDKQHKLQELLTGLTRSEFTGYIKVNFSQGGIGRIEKFEELHLNKGSEPRS
jgi:hypothetical protein